MSDEPIAPIGDNGAPDVVLHLTRAEAEFLLDNADTNMQQGSQLLMSPISEGGKRKVVDLIEGFRPLRDKTKKALGQ